MDKNVVLKVDRRSARGSKASRSLRSKGLIPGVFYGEGGENVPIQLDPGVLTKLVQQGQRVVSLEVDGKGETALIKDVQYDAIGKDIVHADFIRVLAGHTVSVAVPLELHGSAPGEKAGGVIEFGRRSVHIRCLPTAIPDRILVEIGQLELGQVLYVKDLKVPEGVVVEDNPEAPLVSIHLPKAAVVEEAAPAEAAVEPEVIGRKAEEEEGEGEEEK
jgi:large subunit ribosomal protein L25